MDKKPKKESTKKLEPVGSGDLWRDLGFSEEESAALRIRADLFAHLQTVLRASGQTQTALAAALGTDQPKVSKILKGKMSEFSTDRIIEHLESLGVHVGVTMSPLPEAPRTRVPMKPKPKPFRKAPKPKPTAKQLVPAAAAAKTRSGSRAAK